MAENKRFRSPQQLWETFSMSLVHFVENIFYVLGVKVAKHPWRTILAVWIFVILSVVGLLRFHIEKNPMNLWVPPDSDFYKDTNWYVDTFSVGIRFQKILVVSDNILDPKVLVKMHDIFKAVNAINIDYQNKQYSLNDLCYEIPVINNYLYRKPRSVQTASPLNDNKSKNNTLFIGAVNLFADLFSDKNYCDILGSFPLTCYQHNLLNLWQNDPDLLKNASKSDIIRSVNHVKKDPSTGHFMDFTKLLGGINVDENGDIISAKSVLFTFFTQVNMSLVNIDEVGNLVGTEDWVSPSLILWEKKFLDVLDSLSSNLTDVKIYYEAGRSFGDVSGQAMFSDIDKLFAGILLMVIYIIFAISRCNWLEFKLTLGSVGLLCVGMAYASAVSWCSIFGISFGPVHSSLPFLLMGLGVDDMFVMNACWKNLSPDESQKSLPIKIGLMLKHAGVSIVITSFTDIVALLIGAITILPSLKSFCIYAAVGVFFIFIYSVTFFVAVFTLDIRRIQSKRNGIVFCYQHRGEISVSNEDTIFQKLLEKFFSNIVFTIPGKLFVILFTLTMTGFNIMAVLRLEQRFDPKWFIPEGTYYKDFLNAHASYFPNQGESAMVFLGEMDYKHEFTNMLNIVSYLKSAHYVDLVEDWIEPFQNYTLSTFGKAKLSSDEFDEYLSKFLFSSSGGKYKANLKFSEPIQCGSPAPHITASLIPFKFIKFNGPGEYIPAMNDIKKFVKNINITNGDGYRSVWSKAFANWVTDEIIGVEVERNVELALLCVMVCTVILITNLQMCLWVFICVLLTIVNVLGFMQRWGMTVDIVCCIGLELAIGLCVDYAAHIGHTFLTTTEGSCSERSFKTVTTIGTAVLLGGGSTFLSLSLLSTSKAYTFQSFFRIFLLVIFIGLFNGLIFLPVVLSLIGPDAYKPKVEKHDAVETVELKSSQRK